jgi:Holliday junction resolvase RusA-like endonuclease
LIHFQLDLPPLSWLAPKIENHTWYSPRAAEKRAIQYLIREQYKGPLLNEYVHLWFNFLFKPPPSTTKKRKIQMLEGLIIPTRMDCTNMQKFYEDCLKKIVIEDDRLVEMIGCRKMFAEKNKVEIFVFKRGENKCH